MRIKTTLESRELLAVGIFGSASLGDRIEMLLMRGREFSPRASLARVAGSAVVLLILTIASALAPRWIAFAQQPDRPSFEVASIKPGDPDNPQLKLFMVPGGRLVTTNVPILALLGFAYDLRNHQISGIPKSLDSARFTIEAKAPEANSPPPSSEGALRFRLMLQSLLADRFKLVVHRETREEQIYELVVDKGGSKMKEAVDVEDAPRGIQGGGRGQLQGMAAPMQLLVNVFSQQLGHSVIDKTGLSGKYDFTLKWTPDPSAGPPPPGAPAGPPPDPNGPSLFTAVQEQLGLKLQSTKGPVEILVVDHVERPSEN
jgi:bla regulator protein BlaR1